MSKRSGKKRKRAANKLPQERGLNKLLTDGRTVTWIFVAVCAVAVIAAVVVTISALTAPAEPETPKFVPPEFEKNAVAGEPVVDESLGWSQVVAPMTGGFSAHVCGMLVSDGKSVAVWFTNDTGNTAWLKLRLRDSEGTIIGQTGVLKPGEYVEIMELNENAHSGPVTLEVMGYEPETYYSAGTVKLNTELTISK